MTSTSDESQSAPMERPGLRVGMQSEFTIFGKVKPGQEAAAREAGEWSMGPERQPAQQAGVQEIGTVHNFRTVLFDNDTRFVFASVFDGDWDAYIEDFGTSPFFTAAFDRTFQFAEGYPGMRHPTIKDWFAAHQVPAIQYTGAYPDLTVKQIWKNQRVNDAFQAVLDTPEFQEALKNPANAALLATPAFQKLLDEAAG